MTAANSDKFEEQPKTISASLRWQALVLAQMNQERAEACGPHQIPLRKFFEQNVAFLMEIAK